MISGRRRILTASIGVFLLALFMAPAAAQEPRLPSPEAAESAVDELSLPWSWCLKPTPEEASRCKKSVEEGKVEALGARRGDYWKQRNVAYCLGFGHHSCDWFKQNQTLACAWRVVIVGSGNLKVDGGDVSNMRVDCGRLDKAQLFAAQAQARTLYRLIYKREPTF